MNVIEMVNPVVAQQDQLQQQKQQPQQEQSLFVENDRIKVDDIDDGDDGDDGDDDTYSSFVEDDDDLKKVSLKENKNENKNENENNEMNDDDDDEEEEEEEEEDAIAFSSASLCEQFESLGYQDCPPDVSSRHYLYLDSADNDIYQQADAEGGETEAEAEAEEGQMITNGTTSTGPCFGEPKQFDRRCRKKSIATRRKAADHGALLQSAVLAAMSFDASFLRDQSENDNMDHFFFTTNNNNNNNNNNSDDLWNDTDSASTTSDNYNNTTTTSCAIDGSFHSSHRQKRKQKLTQQRLSDDEPKIPSTVSMFYRKTPTNMNNNNSSSSNRSNTTRKRERRGDLRKVVSYHQDNNNMNTMTSIRRLKRSISSRTEPLSARTTATQLGRANDALLLRTLSACSGSSLLLYPFNTTNGNEDLGDHKNSTCYKGNNNNSTERERPEAPVRRVSRRISYESHISEMSQDDDLFLFAQHG